MVNTQTYFMLELKVYDLNHARIVEWYIVDCPLQEIQTIDRKNLKFPKLSNVATPRL